MIRAHRFVAVGLLVACMGNRPLTGQGIGGSLGLGMYRSTSALSSQPGIGPELTGRWASRDGIGVGVGIRYLRFEADERASAFIEVRYAPVPTLTRRLRPIIGVRAGPWVGEGNHSDSPLFGLEAGPVLGMAFRAGTGVSLIAAGDLGMTLDTNLPFGMRRFVPGLQVGITIH